jgi:hypothetical protein
VKQGLKLKQDFGNRRGSGLREGFSQQAFGDAVMAGVKGGQDVHLLRGQTGYTALTAQEAGENTRERGKRPHIPLPRRVEVDALTASLLLGGGVLGT